MAQIIHNPSPRTAILKGMDEVISNLWLGDILSTYNIEQIQEKGITHVISLVDQPLPQWLRTRYQELDIKHSEFRKEDDVLEDILDIMSEVCDLIKKDLNKRKGVLLHCGLGVSRSGSVVIAYLMRAQKIDRDKALKFVKTRRPRVQPNSGFWKQLEIWQSCEYEVWEDNQGVKRGKEDYAEWKSDMTEQMKERTRQLG